MKKLLLIISILLLSNSESVFALNKMGGTKIKSIYGVKQNSSFGNNFFGKPGSGLSNNYFGKSSTSSSNPAKNQKPSVDQKSRWNQISEQYLIEKHSNTSLKAAGNTPDGFVSF